MAVFGFERTSYTALEGTTEEVCVVLRAPTTLGREVTLSVTSEDIVALNSATGRFDCKI